MERTGRRVAVVRGQEGNDLFADWAEENAAAENAA
jgi:hypothetical protein